MTHTAAQRSAELDKAIAEHPEKFRMLSGDRPTGPLHLGHYFGTVQNRVRLQQVGLQIFLLIADYQVITDSDAPADLPQVVYDQVADYLAVGIDPSRATIFTHSAIGALNALLVPFLSLVSVAELRRNPTVKEEFAASPHPAMSALMLAYPVHQAADILFCHATVVPVGQDQLPHLELTRTIARRFAERYAPVFTEPSALLTKTPLLLGTDGKKMSKSRRNSIPLRATADETAALVTRAVTDSQRRISYDPLRRPAVSNLLRIAALCRGDDPDLLAESVGDRGAAALKTLVTEAINERFAAARARRRELADNRGYLRSVLRVGNEHAGQIAETTLTEVRAAMHTRY